MPNDQNLETVNKQKLDVIMTQQNRVAINMDEVKKGYDKDFYSMKRTKEEMSLIDKALDKANIYSLSEEQLNRLRLVKGRNASHILLNQQKFTGDSTEMAAVKENVQKLEQMLSDEKNMDEKSLDDVEISFLRAMKACDNYIGNKNPWFTKGKQRRDSVIQQRQQLAEEYRLFGIGRAAYLRGLEKEGSLKSPVDFITVGREREAQLVMTMDKYQSYFEQNLEMGEKIYQEHTGLLEGEPVEMPKLSLKIRKELSDNIFCNHKIFNVVDLVDKTFDKKTAPHVMEGNMIVQNDIVEDIEKAYRDMKANKDVYEKFKTLFDTAFIKLTQCLKTKDNLDFINEQILRYKMSEELTPEDSEQLDKLMEYYTRVGAANADMGNILKGIITKVLSDDRSLTEDEVKVLGEAPLDDVNKYQAEQKKSEEIDDRILRYNEFKGKIRDAHDAMHEKTKLLREKKLMEKKLHEDYTFDNKLSLEPIEKLPLDENAKRNPYDDRVQDTKAYRDRIKEYQKIIEETDKFYDKVITGRGVDAMILDKEKVDLPIDKEKAKAKALNKLEAYVEKKDKEWADIIQKRRYEMAQEPYQDALHCFNIKQYMYLEEKEKQEKYKADWLKKYGYDEIQDRYERITTEHKNDKYEAFVKDIEDWIDIKKCDEFVREFKKWLRDNNYSDDDLSNAVSGGLRNPEIKNKFHEIFDKYGMDIMEKLIYERRYELQEDIESEQKGLIGRNILQYNDWDYRTWAVKSIKSSLFSYKNMLDKFRKGKTSKAEMQKELSRLFSTIQNFREHSGVGTDGVYVDPFDIKLDKLEGRFDMNNMNPDVEENIRIMKELTDELQGIVDEENKAVHENAYEDVKENKKKMWYERVQEYLFHEYFRDVRFEPGRRIMPPADIEIPGLVKLEEPECPRIASYLPPVGEVVEILRKEAEAKNK